VYEDQRSTLFFSLLNRDELIKKNFRAFSPPEERQVFEFRSRPVFFFTIIFFFVTKNG